MAATNTNVPATWFDLVTDVRTSAQGPLYALGQYREEDGKGYRYFKYEAGTAAITCASGYLLYVFDYSVSPWELTHDVSDSTTNGVRGVAISVVADEGFGWMQTKGYNPLLRPMLAMTLSKVMPLSLTLLRMARLIVRRRAPLLSPALLAGLRLQTTTRLTRSL